MKIALFSISSRGRFALFLLVLVALASLSVAMGISDIDFGSFTSSLMVYLFIIWLLFRRDIGYMRTLSDILWGQWEACAVSNQQKVQLLDVASSELIMKKLTRRPALLFLLMARSAGLHWLIAPIVTLKREACPANTCIGSPVSLV